MFSTKEQLEKRTGDYGVDREEFLTQIVREFHETKSEEAKKQVLGNLANFAYDPINYEFLRKLKVIDIFLENLSANSEIFQEFAVAGLCNLCLDPENREYILHQQGVSHITPLLSSPQVEVVLNAIATLAFLVTPQSKPDINSTAVVQQMNNLAQSPNIRISNLAKVFLSDYTKN